jgi:hypothetical protein
VYSCGCMGRVHDGHSVAPCGHLGCPRKPGGEHSGRPRCVEGEATAAATWLRTSHEAEQARAAGAHRVGSLVIGHAGDGARVRRDGLYEREVLRRVGDGGVARLPAARVALLACANQARGPALTTTAGTGKLVELAVGGGCSMECRAVAAALVRGVPCPSVLCHVLRPPRKPLRDPPSLKRPPPPPPPPPR